MQQPHVSPAMPSQGASDSQGWLMDPRLAPLTATLAGRLRAVCRDWDPAAFDALVQGIARTKLRWADRGYSE